MKASTMAPESANFMDEWVAFSYDMQEVWGHGKTPEKAVAMSLERTGEQGVLFFMDPNWDATRI